MYCHTTSSRNNTYFLDKNALARSKPWMWNACRNRATFSYFSAAPIFRKSAGWQQFSNHERLRSSRVIDGLVYLGGSLPLSSSSKKECTNGFSSAPVLFGVPSRVSLASYVMFITYAVNGGPAALIFLLCCDRLTSNDFLALLARTILDVVDLSVWLSSSMEELLSKLSRFTITTRYVELLPPFLRFLFYGEVLFKVLSPRILQL